MIQASYLLPLGGDARPETRSVALPFASRKIGMSLMDTADGAFMSHAYGWAFASAVPKVYYNISVTSLSVAVAWLCSLTLWKTRRLEQRWSSLLERT